MKKAKYICIEGVDGTGKTTQIKLLKEYLENKGFSVIETKEPGTMRVPLTWELRQISLDNKNSDLIKGFAREFIFQSIRAIHLNNDIYPSLDKVDFIIQDRGILSGLAYGMGYGMSLETLCELSNISTTEKGQYHGINSYKDVYDHIVFFKTSQAASFLENAKNAKSEFETGDGIEAEGSEYLTKVLGNFKVAIELFKDKVIEINVEESEGKLKNKELILEEIVNKLKL
jgi:thymidylate kinase